MSKKEGIGRDIESTQQAIRDFPATESQRHAMGQTREYDLGYLQGKLAGLFYQTVYSKEAADAVRDEDKRA